MCFYRQLHFNCEHRVQWECLELCITAMDSPQPGLCQVRLPVGEVFSEHGFACKYCSINLTAAVDVGRLPNGDNDEFEGGESHHPPIDPRLVNTGGGRQYHPQMTGIDMNQSGDGFWGEGGGGGRGGATSYNMTQGYGNIESRNDELARNQYGYQIIDGAREHLTAKNYPNTPPAQVRPNSQQRYPFIRSEEKLKNRLMSYPYLLPKRIPPQRHPNTKRYELALQGPQHEPLERRRADPSFLQSPAARPPNHQHREPPAISLGDPTTTTRNNTQTTNWSNPLPNDSPKTAKYLKPPYKHEAPYFNYSQDYFDRREASLKSRGVQQLAIIDTLSRVRGSDSPALDLNESEDLYAVTLASETHRYRSDMPNFQARSKVLLKELKNGKDLGDVQFWLRTAEKLKETEGRVAEPLKEMEGWMGTVNQNSFPSWDGNPRRGWCGWVAGADDHLEGGHGYAGTYVNDNGDVPM